MKKIVSLLCAAAMLVGSLALVGCQNGTGASDGNARSAKTAGTGVVMGYVLDNRGEPVEGATVTLGGSVTTTNAGGEFVLSDVPVNVSGEATADKNFQYSVTAKKDGYLSAAIPAIAVSYKESQSLETKDYFAALKELGGYYKAVLEEYAKQAGLTSTQTNILNPTQDLDTGDFVITTTNDSNGKDDVMQTLANAIKDLERLYSDGDYYTQFYSTFGKAVLIPCDASLEGVLKLTTVSKGGRVVPENTYKPATKPVVRATYASANALAQNGHYNWETTVDENGKFKFDKCLPSGVTVTISVDSFFEKINDVEYAYSSNSYDIDVVNSGADATNPLSITTTVDKNAVSAILLLYAQNEKIWVTETNVDSVSTGKLLSTTDNLTFKFNKAMKWIELSESTGINLKSSEYTIDWSEDKKTATVKPVAGYWTITTTENAPVPKVKITGESEEGATEFLKNEFNAYFDTKIWVSLKDTALSYADYNDYLALNAPITLVFSKPMNEKIAVSITNNNSAYDEEWNADKTELTLKPTAKAAYWDITSTDGKVAITVTKEFSNSKDYYTNDFGYWKVGAVDTSTPKDGINDEIDVYFDNFVDVEVAKATVDGHEAFTVTFSKALKSFDKKKTITSVKADTTAITDYEVAIDETGKVLTFTSKGAVFNKKGFYEVTFTTDATTLKLKTVDGSKTFRKAGTKGTTNTASYTTDFQFGGYELKPTAVAIVNEKPDEAKADRAIVEATTAQFIKITFNKEIYSSKIKVATVATKATAPTAADTAEPTNYINGKDVYIPLDEVKAVNKVIVLDNLGSVTAVDGDVLVSTTANKYVDWEELTADLEYRVYAALSLEDSSLVKVTPDVNGVKTYKAADPIENKTVTFKFNQKLPATYKAYVDLYSWNVEQGKYTKSVDTAEITWAEETDTVTFTSDKLIPIVDKETSNTANNKTTVYTTHYLSLVVKNEKGIVLFSTNNAAFPSSVAKTFEKEFANAGLVDTGSATTAGASGQIFNTIKVNVAPYAIKEYNLVDKVVDVAGIESYQANPAVDAKSSLVFTFNALPTGAEAYYDLYEYDAVNQKETKIEENVKVTPADNKVTIPGTKLLSDAVKASKTTGYTEYRLTLSVKDSAENIVFSTDTAKKANFAKVTDSFEQKVFAPATGKAVKDKTDDTKTATVSLYDSTAKKLVIQVKPLTLVSTSLVETSAPAIGQKKNTYKAYSPVAPKSNVTFDFDQDLTGAYVFANVWGTKTKGSSNTKEWLAYLDNKESKGVTVSGTKVTVNSDKFVSYSTTASTNYYIKLQIEKDNKVLYSTASGYFGKVTDSYEKDALATAIKYKDEDFNGNGTTTVIDSTINDKDIYGSSVAIGTFIVPVVKTNVVTIKDKKDSTTTTSTQFAESYNHDINLEFTYNILGYTVVLYKTDATAPVVTTGSESKYAVWAKDNAAKIYTTAIVAADAKGESNKVTLSIGENFFADNETVKVAVFDASNDKLCVLADVPVVDKDKNTNKTYTSKHDATATDDTWLKALKPTALPITDAEIAKVGNGQTVEFGPIDVKFNAKKTAQANYAVYVKDYSSTTVSSDDWRKLTSGYTVVYKDPNGEKVNSIAYQDYKLHSFNKVYISVTFAADAFGFGDKVSVAVLETLDSSRVLYTKTDLQDKFAPVVTINNVNKTTATNAAFQITKDGAAQTATLRIPDLKKVNELEIQGIGANAHAADNSATPPVVAGDAVNADFELSLTGSEWLATAEAKVETGHENSGATEGKRKTNAEIGKVSWTAAGEGKIKFEKTLWFKGDVITITVKDASGNVATYKITIKD